MRKVILSLFLCLVTHVPAALAECEGLYCTSVYIEAISSEAAELCTDVIERLGQPQHSKDYKDGPRSQQGGGACAAHRSAGKLHRSPTGSVALTSRRV